MCLEELLQQSVLKGDDYISRYRKPVSDFTYTYLLAAADLSENLMVNYSQPNDYSYVRCSMKLGRYLTKFYNFTPSQVTHICEEVKSLFTEGKGRFEIVEGKDITKAYFYRNNVPNHGSLRNSCMRYLRCQKYFEIYEDLAKLLIYVPKRGHRVMGRALLWPLADGSYFMDRVYTSESYMNYLFNHHARENKWVVLERNSYVCTGCSQVVLLPEDNYKNPVHIDCSYELPKEYEYFPFMDSFRYIKGNKLTTDHLNADYFLSDIHGHKIEYN